MSAAPRLRVATKPNGRPVETDTCGAWQHCLVVENPRDAEVLRGLIPGASVWTIDDIEAADEEDVSSLAEGRYVLIVLPGNPSRALRTRARFALDRLKPHADEANLVTWLNWPSGTPLVSPSGLDTPGSRLVWLRALPEIGEEEAPVADDPPELASFSNFRLEEREGAKSVKVPLSISEITDLLETVVGKWPKRVVEMLFCEGANHHPIYLTSSARLMAWIAKFARVDWIKGSSFIAQEVFYEHLRMTAEKYEAIETLPHWPSIPDLYYMHRPVSRPTGKLEELIGFYAPATEVDRELIRAMVLTLFWGGAPGARPAFQITGPECDVEQGRGLGKTKLLDTVSALVDGYLDVSPSDSIADIKIRLLSSEARHTRICRLDNIKAHRFSWGELEGTITASVISGRMLYQGEGRRPNCLVWVITVNGSSMSKDMAQRLIPIMLKRPTFAADWEERVLKFIGDHRWEIIADVREALEQEAPPITPSGRWASWERDVLAKTSRLAECQAIIKERQGLIDDDEEEADLIREAFRKNLQATCGQDPDDLCVLISSQTAAQWLSDCCRQPFATNKASAHLRVLSIAELISSRKKTGRGWVWRGRSVDPAANPTPLKFFTKSSDDRDDVW